MSGLESVKQYGDYRDSHQGKGADYHNSFVRNRYRALLWSHERRFLRRFVRDHFDGQPVHHLDVACGTGRVLTALEDTVTTCTGIDISATMLAEARKHTKRAKLVHADLLEEPTLAQPRYNLVTAFRFFPNAEPYLRGAALRRIRTALTDNGYLIFNNHKNSTSLTFRLLRLFGKPFGRSGMTRAEIASMLKETGFTIESTYHVGLTPATDSRTICPLFVMRTAEAITVRCPPLRDLCTNVIYVCRKTGDIQSC
jgi:predicted TPR repeat methyltransferase